MGDAGAGEAGTPRVLGFKELEQSTSPTVMAAAVASARKTMSAMSGLDTYSSFGPPLVMKQAWFSDTIFVLAQGPPDAQPRRDREAALMAAVCHSVGGHALCRGEASKLSTHLSWSCLPRRRSGGGGKHALRTGDRRGLISL